MGARSEDKLRLATLNFGNGRWVPLFHVKIYLPHFITHNISGAPHILASVFVQ